MSKNLIADLDKIISDTKTFILHGRTHEIAPVTAEQFFLLSEKLHQLDCLKEKDYTREEFAKAAHEVIESIAPSVTIEDIFKCSVAQVSGLFRIIIDTVTGKVETQEGYEEQVKKNHFLG